MADYQCERCGHVHSAKRRPGQCEGCGTLTGSWITFICCRWWQSPRADAPRSVDVNHVCAEELGHDGPCVCTCGAVS